MRVIFAGTPEFACTALRSLHSRGFEIALVLTQPDRPAGRGMQLQASSVKQFALVHGIPLAQPRSLRLDGKFPEDAASAQDAIAAAQADVMVVAAYGLILPQWVLNLPRYGCLNIHASLLPRWRGAAPIHRAIEAGDVHTGITIMQMDAGLDTGDMLWVAALPIDHTSAQRDTTTSLHDKLATLGGSAIIYALDQLAIGGLQATPQPQADNPADAASAGISYAHKIDKSESRIDWSQSAQTIERKVRALSPSPGCTAVLRGETIKITRSEIDSCLRNIHGGFGYILQVNSEGITVQCGAQALIIRELQRAGGKRLLAADFLRGFAVQEGERFE